MRFGCAVDACAPVLGDFFPLFAMDLSRTIVLLRQCRVKSLAAHGRSRRCSADAASSPPATVPTMDFAIYDLAWKRARNEGALVRYQAQWPDHAGFFKANHGTSLPPNIQIYRPKYKSPSTKALPVFGDDSPVPDEQLRAELITYAHEYGHLMSFRRETPRDEWLRYVDLEMRRSDIVKTVHAELGDDGSQFDAVLRHRMLASYTDDEREMIIREETLAWRIGRDLLASLGFDDLAGLEVQAQHGLHNHRYRLGIEDLWECDGTLPRCTVLHS